MALFKARGQFRQQRLRVDDDLTKAQQKSCSERWPFLQHFRELQPGLNPHFIRDMIYIWEGGHRVLLPDSEAARREWRARGGSGGLAG